MPQIPFRLPELGEKSYSIWSTVVDAPLYGAMTRSELAEELRRRYGYSEDEIADAMWELEAKNIGSVRYRDVDDLISFNRAGDRERHLTRSQLAQLLCENG